MDFSLEQFDGFAVIDFSIPGGVIEPSSLAGAVSQLAELGLSFDQGLVLSGRGPIWLFCALAHELHPAKWVACNDPRLGAGVVVQSHTKGISVGQLIKLE
jgi:CRISPR-associated protein Csx3